MKEKTRENRIRRKVTRLGYVLTKSRRKDPDAVDFGCYVITDLNNCVIWGAAPGWFDLSLDDVEAWIQDEVKQAE